MLGTSHKKGVSKGENMINWTGGSHTYSKICWEQAGAELCQAQRSLG